MWLKANEFSHWNTLFIARFHINQGIDWNLWPDWIECFTFISHLLTVLSASINFYIYYFARYKIKSMNCLSECCSTKESSSPTIRLMQLWTVVVDNVHIVIKKNVMWIDVNKFFVETEATLFWNIILVGRSMLYTISLSIKV